MRSACLPSRQIFVVEETVHGGMVRLIGERGVVSISRAVSFHSRDPLCNEIAPVITSQPRRIRGGATKPANEGRRDLENPLS
jgi:hypothetical protein